MDLDRLLDLGLSGALAVVLIWKVSGVERRLERLLERLGVEGTGAPPIPGPRRAARSRTSPAGVPIRRDPPAT